MKIIGNITLALKRKKYIKLETKNELFFDIGLGILRPILAFTVILTHCYNYNYARDIWALLGKKAKRFLFHVPTFFIISFYFSQKTLSSSNYKKKFERFQRLFLPYLLWPIIYYLLNKLLIKYLISPIRMELTIKDLKHQLLYGSGNMCLNIMWFQWDLIFLTICFNLIIFCSG